jgi:glycosyltransferase involved in cell wall biosynthesis
MKVLILHNDLRVYWKGRIKYLRQFLAANNIDLFSLELFGKGSPYAFDSLDIDNCLFPNNSFDELTKGEIQHKLFKKLDEIKPDVIIGGSIVFFAGALGLRWCKEHNKHFIMFDDGKTSDIKRNLLVQYIKDKIISEVDALWLPSEDYDVEYDGVFNKPTIYFHGYNTIDNQIFKIDGEKKFDHKVIICVARLVEIKNIDNLLKAWRLVEDKNHDYTLLLIGSGPEHDKLIKLKDELQLKHVDFAGVIANTEIPKYLFNSDAFILASFAESWGLVVNEAMAAGLPMLISKKINAATALIKEGGNGYLFDPYNINEIAGKILKFIDLDLPAKKEMSDKSLQIIGTMSYENMGDVLLKVLKTLTIQKPKRSSIIGGILINLWKGGYNTSGWDK